MATDGIVIVISYVSFSFTENNLGGYTPCFAQGFYSSICAQGSPKTFYSKQVTQKKFKPQLCSKQELNVKFHVTTQQKLRTRCEQECIAFMCFVSMLHPLVPRDHYWQCLGNHMWCQRLYLHQLCARPISYMLVLSLQLHSIPLSLNLQMLTNH